MRQTLYRYIVSFLTIIALWLGGVPFLFSKAVPVICENLSYNYSYTISVENPKLCLNIVPVATIKTGSIKINSKNSKDYILTDNLQLKIRILPLLSGRLHIDKIGSDNIDINTTLDKNIALDRQFFSDLKSIKVKCDCLEIKKIKLSIHRQDINQSAEYSAKDLFYKKNGRYVSLNADSTTYINNILSTAKFNIFLPRNNDVKNSKIEVQISNFDISTLFDYFKNFLPDELTDIKGIININVNKHNMTAVCKNIKIMMKDAAKSIIFPDELKINSDLNLTRKTITIENAQIKAKNIDLVIGGTITDYINGKIPNYNLYFRINKSKIEDFINMLPSFKTEDIDVYKLKKYKFFGDIIGNFSVKGHNLEPSVTGSIFINNGILIKPIPNAAGATIKLDFKGKYLNYDITVPASRDEKVWVNGGVELYNVKYADMRVWSTQNVDLATAEEKVVPIHEILNFVIGPVPIMDIKGVGNIDIIIKGNRKNPHVWGKLNFRDVVTHFYEMPDLILKKVVAELTFDDEIAAFTLKKGVVNDKDININGTCNLSGKFDFDVSTNNQQLEYLHKAIMSSTMIDEIKKMLSVIGDASGPANLKLKIFGNIKDIAYIKFNENFFVKGSIDLLDNIIVFNGIKVQKTKGNVNFENTNANLNITSFLGNFPLTVKAAIKDNLVTADISIPKFNLRDIVSRTDAFGKEIADIYLCVTSKYKGKADKIEYDKLDFTANVIDVGKDNKLKLSNGTVILKNNKLQIKDFDGKFTDTNSMFNINIQANNLSTQPVINGIVQLKDFELCLINMFGRYEILPEHIRNIINSIKFEKGKINLKAKIINNNVNTSTNLGGIEFTYVPNLMPVKIINGSIFIRKNFFGINKINIIAEDMPVLIDGGINNIFSKPDFNLYINSKPNQNFIDKYINNNRLYPIKVKGDIVYWLKFKGTKDNLNITSETNIAKDSSIYYLGATVGDIENSIILNLDMNVLKQNILKIKEFSYDKLIDSQGKRQTRLNMLKADGGINIIKDDLILNDLRIKTSHPTDARIFNILFRKPNIKQGQFTSDLRFNGRLSNPNLIGNFHIVETNIPFLDTTMKNLSFIFREKTIELSSTGEVLGNDIKFKGVLRNRLKAPFYIENAELYTKILDFNYITNELKMSQVNETNAFDSLSNVNLSNTIIKNLKLKANEIRIRNLMAENVEAVVSLSDKNVFNINNFNSKIANGTLSGNYSYNFNSNDVSITVNAKDINANDITVALFDLNNQIYGDLTGHLKLSCNGSEFNKCMETLNGNLEFDVKDGKMPKLGSLEYLLKAGNLVKGGITGISVNGVIDILTPLKTGDFSEIYGKMSIKNGLSDNIEIATKGKDLSLFITGSYDFGASEAKMEVLGLLSKKISTMFGPLGNVSLNTLFNIVPGVDLAKDSKLLDKINKIPGIELSSKAFRKFIAEINGNINGDDYVSSFKWIN